MCDFIRTKVEKHKQDFDINNLRDFTDYYLKSVIDNEGIDGYSDNYL